jgi:hypothetical protein
MLKNLAGIAARSPKLQALIELVEALERRVPRPQMTGERNIAADSARLHARASEGIRQIRSESTSRENAETEAAHSVMSDDGGPETT